MMIGLLRANQHTERNALICDWTVCATHFFCCENETSDVTDEGMYQRRGTKDAAPSNRGAKLRQRTIIR